MIRRLRPTGPAHWPHGPLAVVLFGLGLSLSGCSGTVAPSGDDAAADRQPRGPEQPGSEPGPSAKQPASARSVLRSMVAAYRQAAGYTDAGTLHLKGTVGEDKIDDSANFSVTLARPNKIHLEAYQAVVVCDGRQLHATLVDLPGQMIAREAPEKLTIESLYVDPILTSVLREGIVGPPRQLMLLLEDDPLRRLLEGSEGIALLARGTIDGRDYHRVEIKGTQGRTVLWIDPQSHVLRRIVFPTGQLRRGLQRYGPVGSVSLVADLKGAQLGGEVKAKAFQFDRPTGAELVRFFVPPDPAQLLGKRVPDFRFVDLEGKPLTPESLAGKISVLEFWSTSCGACRMSLPILEEVAGQYEEDDRVRIFAVSVDGPNVEDRLLRQTLDGLGVHVPNLRDREHQMGTKFNSTGTPTRFLIDGQGVVQDVEEGVNPDAPDLAGALAGKIGKLLAGEDIYQEPLEEYQQRVQQREQRLKAWGGGDPAAKETARELQLPRAEIAPRTDPQTLKLAELWKCTELTAPGNILVVTSGDLPSGPGGNDPAANGQPRLLVVDAGTSVAEVGLDGKLIADHPLDIQPSEIVSTLRTAVGADGQRYVAALASAQQRFHLFDPHWNRMVSYPEDALQNRHSGIADVQLGDLDGDGTPEAYVGYWGVVGVQRVSLEGTRLWSNRSVSNVERMAVGGPDAAGTRHLVCVNSNSSQVAEIDSSGRRVGEITVAGRMVHWIVAADLTGDGQPEWCALAARKLGEDVAVGLNLRGEVLWEYPLPRGVRQQPIEPVIAGKLTAGDLGQWLLPGADGSIQVIAADGKPLDRFNYGAPLAGLATAVSGETPLLLVSTPDGLEAWKVE